jgi:predicted ArsR family transcriptional regulator
MAWTYYCTEEDVTLRGDTHDDLVDELMRHLRDNHDEDVSRAEAEAMVARNGRQEAA